MNAIRRVLAELIGSDDRQAVAQHVAPRIDEGNRSKAFRHLYRVLDEGQCGSELVERLATAFPDYATALREAYATTLRIWTPVR